MEDSEEFYVCVFCGHEDHPDAFGRYCPKCGEDLDEADATLRAMEEGDD